MKFKLILLILLFSSCSQNYVNNVDSKIYFKSKGLALIYTDDDHKKKIVNKKLDNDFLQVAHYKLRPGVLLKIINTRTKDEIILKNSKRVKYPDLYTILMTKKVANKLNLTEEFPFVEVLEIKKNKSFIAKKTKIYKEEETIHSNAPIETVKIANISKNQKKRTKQFQKKEIYIIIGDFYSKSSANTLIERITRNLTNFDSNKLYIKTKNTNKIRLLSGPYRSINLMKNDYIQLKNFGFEELDITINE